MDEQHDRYAEDDADDLLRRALIDPEASVAVALRVDGLALADALTVVFHGRADLGTIQTYVAHGPRGAGDARSPRTSCCASRATSTSPTPRAATRPRRCTPSRRARCATRSSPPTPCSRSGASRSRTWPRARSRSTRSLDLDVRLPAHRLMPIALVAPDTPSHDRAGLRRAHARRGPAADGDRVRAAGRRARLSAARTTPSAASRTSRSAPPTTPADGRAPRAPGGLGAALPGAQRGRRAAAQRSERSSAESAPQRRPRGRAD